MSDYRYTYDARQDYEGFENLTEAQRELGDRINRQAREDGGDRYDLLVAADAPAADKEALNVVWGGPNAAGRFLP
jgi:hypothetical protein